jgi:mono/diheme cytochrome c family protein
MVTILSCSNPKGNNPGTEYMPDMAHSIAYEANYYDYYSRNTWGTESEYYKMAKPRKPVNGTIPRGYAAKVAVGVNDIAIPPNGNVPYYYGDTEEERTRAMNEIFRNPFPITADGLARGKELYNIYCGICHGEKGDGNGYIVDEKNPHQVYPAQPAILTTDDFVNASEGRYYHAIMYGKNVMGSHADKLSYEERWQVIHYIRSLQAKDRKLKYNEEVNTLNTVGVPGASLHQKAATKMAKIEVPTLDNHGGHGKDHDDHSKGGHSSDDGHGHGH